MTDLVPDDYTAANWLIDDRPSPIGSHDGIPPALGVLAGLKFRHDQAPFSLGHLAGLDSLIDNGLSGIGLFAVDRICPASANGKTDKNSQKDSHFALHGAGPFYHRGLADAR